MYERQAAATEEAEEGSDSDGEDGVAGGDDGC